MPHASLINSLILCSLLNSSFLYPGCDGEVNVSSVGNNNKGFQISFELSQTVVILCI